MYCAGISYNGKGRVAATVLTVASSIHIVPDGNNTVRFKFQSTWRTLVFLNLITIIFSTSLTVFISQLSLAPTGLINQVGASLHSTPDSTNKYYSSALS